MQLAVSRGGARTIATIETIPPPVGGWNARDPVTMMKVGDAQLIENWVCRSDGLEIRPGQELRCSGLDGEVQTVMAYTGAAAGHILLAATPTSIYSVDQADDGPMITGLTSGVWSSAMQTNPGGAWLVACNGADAYRHFNGTTWTAGAITSAQQNRSITSSAFSALCVHMGRVFLVEKGSLRVWYLDHGAIQGPARCIDLAPLCNLGGELVCIESMTTDGARNVNDRLVAVTSQGEMIIYGGVNPARADQWQKIGVFSVPPPVGVRCLMNNGGDVLYLSTSGMLPVSGIMAPPDPDKPLVAITDKVRNAYLSAIRLYQDSPTWCMAESSLHRVTLINCPASTGITQMVRASDQGSKAGWSLWRDIEATSWGAFGVDLFFGTADGSVYRLGGDTDDGAAITGSVVEAYTRLGTPARKKASRIRPAFIANGAVRARMTLRVDYQKGTAAVPAPTSSLTGALWTWTTLTSWGQTPTAWVRNVAQRVDGWRGISGHGHAFALAWSVSSTEAPLTYAGSDIAIERGGGI